MARKKKSDNINQTSLEFDIQKTENFEKKTIKKKRASKKKVVEEKPFIPSKYQEVIFDYVQHKQGNLIVEACSGSGKTTTILKCMSLLPEDSKVLFAAFNKDIVTAIKKKLGKDSKAHVKTIHGLGYQIISRFIGEFKLDMNEFKYPSYISSSEFKRKIRFNDNTRVKSDKKVIDNVKKLFNFSRCNLCGSVNDIVQLADKYSIDLIGNEPELILDLMEYGKHNLEVFDFTDLIWLPNVLDMTNNYLKYDYVIVDEVQDVNKAQLHLILSCFKMGTRGIFVGDENQLIYGFTGTDTDSFNEIRALPNTVSLPLSISYRCPKRVVDFVHDYCDTIEAKEDAIDGDIIQKATLNEVKEGDAVICRNNAPLFKAYAILTEMGKEPILAGNDLSGKLIEAIKSTKSKKLNVKLNDDGVFGRLYYDLIKLKNDLIEKYSISEDDAVSSSYYTERLDVIQTLELLSIGLDTSEELIDKIKKLFSNKRDKASDIILTTAHKSKGLEFNNVFILCNSLFHKGNLSEWERKQEKNLAYVAYTRTKNNLCFIDEKEFDSFLGNSANNKARLSMIQKDIERIYDCKINTPTVLVKDVSEIKPIDMVENNIVPMVTDIETAIIKTDENKSGLFSLSNRRKQLKRK